MPEKKYLGDGVYFEDHGFQIRLTTENGLGIQNEIFLDDSTFRALCLRIEESRRVKIDIQILPKVPAESVGGASDV